MRHPVSFHTLLAIALIPFVALPARGQDEDRGREPAAVMSYHGARWLERPTREEEEQPEKVLDYMQLEPGMHVVDLGCGSGYFARRMAKRVMPGGKVYGVDIQPEMLDIMMQIVEAEEVEGIEPVLGDEKDPKLPDGTIDWMLMADVYHEFQYPEAMLAEMLKDLKPDGKVCLLEYRAEEFRQASHIKPDHRMTVRQVLKEWNAAGFELIDLQEFLPSQHMFIFQRRPDRE